jgi:hypothetical protein
VARREAGFGPALLGLELWGVRGGDGGFWRASCCRIVKAEGPSAECFVDEEVVVCDSIFFFWASIVGAGASTASFDSQLGYERFYRHGAW